MKTHSRYQTARKILLFWCLFIGIGAVAGAIGMLTAPDGSNLGMQDMLPYFQVLPFADVLFQNFMFPGIALLCVNGIPNLAAAVLLMLKKKSGAVCGAIFGGTLMAWICIQFVIFPMNFMSTIYFVFGVAQAATGIAALIFHKQEQFRIEEEDYANIGADKTRLIAYFSRMGYTKKAAMEEANRTGGMLYEIKATQRTEGTGGFWWCGRYGMHRWEMPIEPVSIDLSQFERVTICSPIWVFHVAAPVRAFCKAVSGNIKKADYILVHFQNVKYKNAAVEMDCLLGITAQSVSSICTRRGRVISRKTIRETAAETIRI